MVYILLFFLSSKCSLFHNSNLFGSCIIHNLYTECAKIKIIIKIPAPKDYWYIVSVPDVVAFRVFICS